MANGTGASYGFSNPAMEAPANPIAAYRSQWFTNTEITAWQVMGANKSVVVVDFGTDTDGVANFYAVGLKCEGTLSGEAILTAVQLYISAFSFSMSGSEISAVTFDTNTQTGTWNVFKGKNLAHWTDKMALSRVTLSNNDWLGLSFGVRRLFKPQEMAAYLGVNINTKDGLIRLYPNPVKNILHISSIHEIKEFHILDQNGCTVKEAKGSSTDVSALSQGIYFLKTDNGQHIQVEKFIKR